MVIESSDDEDYEYFEVFFVYINVYEEVDYEVLVKSLGEGEKFRFFILEL